MTHVAIVGAGAAGLMCAASLLEFNDTIDCVLYEKNRHLGAKVIISGGGRCNVTTSLYRKQDLQDKYIRGWNLVRHAIAGFGPRQIIRRFQDHGVALKNESDGRVFPVSDDGHDIVGAFATIFGDNPRISVRLGTNIISVQPVLSGGFDLALQDGTLNHVDTLVIATGGNAYRHTGSTGDGYSFAKSCGHQITPLGPSLCSFHTNNSWLHACSGLSFPQARLHRDLSHDTIQITSATGPVLLTHFGISGPATFVMSAHMAFTQIDPSHLIGVRLQIDHQKDRHRWAHTLQQGSLTHPRQQLNNFLHVHLTDRLVGALLQHLTYDPQTTMSQLSKSQKQKLSSYLGDGIPLSLQARRAGDEFVTAGGVCADQIDPKTLQSLLCPGLYLAGEVLDVDAVTGGYNLTSSRASGRLVASHIAKIAG